MASVEEHYKNLLADHYTWMFGVPFVEKVSEQVGMLTKAGIVKPGIAVDLGCGPGFQSIALAQLGAQQVYAIDSSARLLEELKGHATDKPVQIISGNILDISRLVPKQIDTVVCMGDTLTHLTSREEVTHLFQSVASILENEGRFVISYRDLAVTPTGIDRFIPLRSTPKKIMTCFLERIDDSVVMVHDLIYVLEDDEWCLSKSAYPKLVLPIDEIVKELSNLGFVVAFQDNQRGLHTLSLRLS